MLTIREAARVVNVEPQTVRSYINKGVGKELEKLKAQHVRHGRRLEWRIKQSDLDYFRKKYLI